MRAYEYIIKRRYHEEEAIRITGTVGATRYLQSLFYDDTVENFIILALDRENWLIGDKILAIGTHNRVLLTAQEVIYAAGCFHAAALVLAHNHPTGDLTPTDADLQLERDVQAAAETINLKLHDHIILVPEQPDPPPPPWSEREVVRLRDLLAARTPIGSLALQLHRTSSDIKAKAEEMIWLIPGQKLYI